MFPKAQPGTYLTFRLNDQIFGLTIDRVREIVECDSTITPVPRTPSFMLGVMNLRGQVVAVVDMNEKLGLPSSQVTPDTCIIIVEVGDTAPVVLGVLVDGVEEVVDFCEDNLLAAPATGTSLPAEFLTGLARRDEGGFAMLLQVNYILGSKELGDLGEAQAASSRPPSQP